MKARVPEPDEGFKQEFERKRETLALARTLIPKFDRNSGYFWRFWLNMSLPSSPPYSVAQINKILSKKFGLQTKLTEDELKLVLIGGPSGGDISGITGLGTAGGTFFTSLEVSPGKYVFYIMNVDYDRPKAVIDAARRNPAEWYKDRDIYGFVSFSQIKSRTQKC